MSLGPTDPRPSEPSRTFEMPLPENEVGASAYRQWEYALGRPPVRVLVLVSSWGQLQGRKLLGFRLSSEREWHCADGSGHWCEDCVLPCGCRVGST